MTTAVRDARELGRRGLGRGHDEHRVGQAATCGRPRGTTGRLGHGVRVGVDADDEPGRVGGSGGQHVAAVAGAEVDHDPGGAGPSSGELADVHLVDAPADHGAHARTVRDRAGCRNGRDRAEAAGRAAGTVEAAGASPTLRAMSELPIRPYERLPAAFHPWDPRTRDVALDVARLVASARPGTVAQHVGSSSVPGMPGKNVVDLGVEADPDEIPEITDTLLSLGFQRQSGLAPFPPTRPLMVGNVDHDGTSFRVHLHVMPPARHELTELLAFRDALRADPALRDGYARSKQEFVEAAPDGDANLLYTIHKGGFVLQSLYRLGIRKGPADAPDAAPAGLDDRDPRGRAAGPDAGDRRPRARLPHGRPRPRPGLPGRVGRRPDRRRRLRRRRGRAAAGRDGRRRDLRAGARGARRRGRGRRAGARCARGWRRSKPPATGSPNAGSSARSGSGPRRGARSVASTTPAPPPRRWATRCGSRCRSAGTTGAARPGSRTRTGSRPR